MTDDIDSTDLYPQAVEADHEDSNDTNDLEEGERDEDLALVFSCPRHSGTGDVKMETIMQVGLFYNPYNSF